MVDQGGSVRGRVYTTSSVVYNTVTQETGGGGKVVEVSLFRKTDDHEGRGRCSMI